ncbi:MAG: XRE family transcriptional regulator [Dehalococcoidia bacterium]
MSSALERIAYQQATRTAVPEIASSLQELFGQKLVALIVGIENPKAVGEWGRPVRKPHPETERRLREAYHITSLLGQVESAAAIRAWFVGMNPDLDDRTPALVLQEDPAQVLRAARSFLTGG